MASAYAALVSIINIVERIQRRLPITHEKLKLGSLHEKTYFIIDFLVTSNYSTKQLKDFDSRITDAAYAAKDMIETLLVNVLIARPTGQADKIPTVSFPSIEKVMEEMDLIKQELMEMEINMGIQHMQLGTAPLSSSIPFGNKNTMVGFRNELIEIMEKLLGQQSSRQIIPIVGMGGIGKTKLAENVFENPSIVHYFDIRVWVSISQEYDTRQILLEILRQVKRGEDLATFLNHSNQMSEEGLGESLYKSLCGMRYFVVMDDMWSVEPWETFKSFFPDNNCCSRIIVTTRLSSVADHFGSCSLRMNLLDEYEGWNLFCQQVFGQEACPVELEGIGREIVNNCKGLPLSITVIGGLLAKSDGTEEYWEYVSNYTTSIISSEDDEHCTKILSLSYHSLPIYLKPCFLYMAIFPEDKVISASWLIDVWVGEGLIRADSTIDFEVVGERYLNNLISRNLIISHRLGSNGKVKSCKIHDLLRDLCLKEACKEKFLYMPDMREEFLNVEDIRSSYTEEGMNSQRRISISQILQQENLPRILHELKLGLLTRSLICDFDGGFSLHNFMLLRILHLDDIDSSIEEEREFRYLLDDVYQLVTNQNVVFSHFWDFSSLLPPPLYLLWNLQTLIVKGTWRQTIAGSEIWEMVELRHLKFISRILPIKIISLWKTFGR